MSNEPLMLAGDFAVPTRADWEREVLKVLNRRRPEGTELTIEKAMARLRTKTVDGLVIEPLYTKTDRELGYPGVAPFTRGTQAKSGEADAWGVRQLHEDSDAAATKAAIESDLARGVTSVWLRVDPDALAADQVADVLAGVKVDAVPVAVSSQTDQAAAADALAAVWRASGAAAQVRGNLGLDALTQSAFQGTAVDYSAQRAWVKTAQAEFPAARAICINAAAYHNAGAADVDELAYAIATGVEYLRDLDAAGVSPTEAFGQIEFRVSATADEFLTIARLRALRRLWARIGEVSGVPAEKRGAVQQAVTSWRMITRDDPWVNLLRGTIATFGASVGGAESITTLPFDAAHGLPNEFSRRLARNTQIIAAEESNIGRVADPAGGSWYVETLTDELCAAAWKQFQGIEAVGGMAKALADGLVTEQLNKSVAERAKRLSTRKQPITGVSMFPLAEETPVERKPRPTVAAPAGGLKQARDSEVFEALRDRSSAAAAAGSPPQVLLACLGVRRDFGGREMFTSNLLLAGGIAHPTTEGGTPEEIVAQVLAAGASRVILCSSAKVYASQAVGVAKALKDAGIKSVYIAGRLKETADPAAGEVIDGEVFDGMDVVGFLGATLDALGVAK